MKFLAVSALFSVALAVSIPSKTERFVEDTISNAKRMAAGLPLKKPRSLYSPHVHAPRASPYAPTSSGYSLYGCVDDAFWGSAYTSGSYTTMNAAEAACSAQTQAEGFEVTIEQDSSNTPVYYYCTASPGNIVACSSTNYVYYKYNP